ncbi:MAG: hypothetical protein WAX89_04515 [Alphaproteobacteria bacterium]
MLILVPQQIHDIFTLSEVFDYAAFNALPLGNDYQLADDIFEDSRATFPYELQREDGHRYGELLPPEPESPEVLSPDILEKLGGINPSFIEFAAREYQVYQQKQAAWQEKYDDLVETTKSKVFLALKEGRLIAKGRLIRQMKSGVEASSWSSDNENIFDEIWEEVEPQQYNGLVSHAERDLELEAMQDGDLDNYLLARQKTIEDYGNPRRRSFEHGKVIIPASFWRLDGIDWQSCTAKSPSGWFAEIYCFSESVFSCFPLPAIGETTVKSMGGFFAIDETASKFEVETGTTKRGRPPSIDWHAFDVELFRLIIRKEVPDKQESLIALMQEWSVNKWGIAPKRTAVLERVSPFIKLKSEN